MTAGKTTPAPDQAAPGPEQDEGVAVHIDVDLHPPSPPEVDADWAWGEGLVAVVAYAAPLGLVAFAVLKIASYGLVVLFFGLAGYGFMLLEASSSDTLDFLKHQVRLEALEAAMAAHRAGVPRLVMWGEASHVDKSRVHTRMNSNTRKTTKTVVTHRATAPLDITGWQDRSPGSGLPEEVRGARLVKVDFELHWQAADGATKAALERFKADFDAANNRDEDYSSGVRMVLDGFQPRALCVQGDGALPCWATPGVFWAAALTGTLGFFMMALDGRCARLVVPIVKEGAYGGA